MAANITHLSLESDGSARLPSSRNAQASDRRWMVCQTGGLESTPGRI